jgi:hypothetical protein
MSSPWKPIGLTGLAVAASTALALAQDNPSDPGMATIVTTRMPHESMVFVGKIDGVQQKLPRDGFLGLFVSTDDQSYQVTPGLHVFEMQYYGDRTRYINRARILVRRGHRYAFYAKGEALKFRDITLDHNIPLRPDILTGAVPPAQSSTIVINIVRPPAGQAGAAQVAHVVITPAAGAAAASMRYDQWEKLHSEDGTAPAP